MKFMVSFSRITNSRIVHAMRPSTFRDVWHQLGTNRDKLRLGQGSLGYDSIRDHLPDQDALKRYDRTLVDTAYGSASGKTHLRRYRALRKELILATKSAKDNGVRSPRISDEQVQQRAESLRDDPAARATAAPAGGENAPAESERPTAELNLKEARVQLAREQVESRTHVRKYPVGFLRKITKRDPMTEHEIALEHRKNSETRLKYNLELALRKGKVSKAQLDNIRRRISVYEQTSPILSPALQAGRRLLGVPSLDAVRGLTDQALINENAQAMAKRFRAQADGAEQIKRHYDTFKKQFKRLKSEPIISLHGLHEARTALKQLSGNSTFHTAKYEKAVREAISKHLDSMEDHIEDLERRARSAEEVETPALQQAFSIELLNQYGVNDWGVGQADRDRVQNLYRRLGFLLQDQNIVP